MDELRSCFVDTGTVRLHALETGPEDAPVIVLLHGFPEFSESWRDVMLRLGDAGFKAIAPDLRGYGASDKPDSGYDLGTLARDIAGLIERIAPDGRAHLVGHDWGGAIAYHVAAMHPDRVHTLAVVNAPHPRAMMRELRHPQQLLRSWYMLFFQVPLLPEFLLTRGRGRLVSEMIRRASVDRSRLTPERLRRYAEAFVQPRVARSALAYYRQTARAFVARPGPYPRIQAPFRLIWGVKDVALRKELTLGLEPFFVHPPEIDYLPETGHFAPIEAPDQVAASILAHVNASRSPYQPAEHGMPASPAGEPA